MKVKVGLVGLPNVGKSTLFNAIAQRSIADAKNFPFCTIEPNVTPVPIPDSNICNQLSVLAKSKKALPATILLVDVAGLVAGASRGEGLGNKFLATVRECDLIIHLSSISKDSPIESDTSSIMCYQVSGVGTSSIHPPCISSPPKDGC